MERLTENPFSAPTPNGGTVNENTGDSHAFGFDRNEMRAYIGYSRDHHDQIYRRYDGYKTPMQRGDFRYPGRFWRNSKVISFWVYPNRYKFFPLMKTLEEEWKETFPKKEPLGFKKHQWYVEVHDDDVDLLGHLVKFENYTKKHDPEDLPHTTSLTESDSFYDLAKSIL